jgi:Tol biopolymer transport system component
MLVDIIFAWLPGKKTPFNSDRDGDFEVFTVRADGSRRRNRTKKTPWRTTIPPSHPTARR